MVFRARSCCVLSDGLHWTSMNIERSDRIGIFFLSIFRFRSIFFPQRTMKRTETSEIFWFFLWLTFTFESHRNKNFHRSSHFISSTISDFLCRYLICLVVLASTGTNSLVKDDQSSSSAAADGAKSKSSSMSSSEEGCAQFFVFFLLSLIRCSLFSSYLDIVVLWSSWTWIFLRSGWRLYSRSIQFSK